MSRSSTPSRRPSQLKIRSTACYSSKLDGSVSPVLDLGNSPLLRRICSSPKLFVTADIGPKSSKRTKKRVMMASPLGPPSPEAATFNNSGSGTWSQNVPASPCAPLAPSFARTDSFPIRRSFSTRESRHRRSLSSQNDIWTKRALASVNQSICPS